LAEAEAGPIELIDLHYQKAGARANEQLRRVLRKSLDRDYVGVSLAEEVFNIEALLDLIVGGADPEECQLRAIGVDQEAVGAKGEVVEEGYFLELVVLEPPELHSGHRAPNSCVSAWLLMYD
jgi:hypothetical protein